MKQLEDKNRDENGMLPILEEMMAHVCDSMCPYPKEIKDEEELEKKCADCEMGDHICHILNEYEKINDFEKTQCGMLMKKYCKFVRCDECEHRAYEKTTDVYWCRLSGALDGRLKKDDGCSRGKIQEKNDKEKSHGK